MAALAQESKVWVYQIDRDLSAEEENKIGNLLEEFCLQWTAHNMQLKAGFSIEYHRFILLFVDETKTNASGCSIDKSVAFLKNLNTQFQIDVFGRTNMAYLKDNSIKTLTLSEIDSAYQKKEIDEDTLFFNTGIRELSELKTNFVLPLSKHWLMQRISN